MAYTTINDPSAHFFMNHYTGSGSSGLQVRNTANAGDLTPDWLWIKPTSLADNHVAFDSNRGFDKQLKVHSTDAEDTHGSGLQIMPRSLTLQKVVLTQVVQDKRMIQQVSL